ncbi:hypothetical protein [Aquihabitans sp. McL0605]|uniref:hypothetical protein n=1 Tax=Aquihabitans sp. McL0605 TaxID=3415671 RepID=UPI003CEC0D72
MDEELRDEYLDEVAAAVRSTIRSAAEAVDSNDVDDGELRFGRAWDPLQRLHQVLVTTEQKADFVAVVAEFLSTLAHSLLVTLDGGTALAADGRKVFLTDRNGEEIADVLHERLFDHLDLEEAVRSATT